jgi:hypothetical protein
MTPKRMLPGLGSTTLTLATTELFNFQTVPSINAGLAVHHPFPDLVFPGAISMGLCQQLQRSLKCQPIRRPPCLLWFHLVGGRELAHRLFPQDGGDVCSAITDITE